MSRTSRPTLTAELRTDHLTEDEHHRLLTAEERRLAIDVLAGQASSIGLEALAVEVATQRESAIAVEDETVEQVALLLHHAHLPKMDDMGVLDYDPQTNTVNPRLDPC